MQGEVDHRPLALRQQREDFAHGQPEECQRRAIGILPRPEAEGSGVRG